jgi:hypothetical protein
MSDTRSVYERLLAKNPGETEQFDKSVSYLRSRLREIVSDPDFGDPVLGTDSTKNKALTQNYQELLKNNLYPYLVNEQNPGTYTPPILSPRTAPR